MDGCSSRLYSVVSFGIGDAEPPDSTIRESPFVTQIGKNV